VDNAALGRSALQNNTTGNHNTASGRNALLSNTTGARNSSFGKDALYSNTTGVNNTAVGMEALNSATTGGANSAMGQGALEAVTDGINNSGLGKDAGFSTTTGNHNTFLGKDARNTNAGDSSSNVLGYNVSGTANYTTLGVGTADIRTANGSTSWATVSDERYKKDITTSTAGLSFVNELRPVTWNYKTLGELPTTFNAYEADSTQVFKNTQTNHGFIAQEVKAVIDSHSEIKDGFRLWDDRDDGSQEVAEAALIPVLVKAIQELTARLEILEG